MPEISLPELKKDIVDWYTGMIPIKAISPASGGEGESERADFISEALESLGYHNFQRIDVIDKHGKTRSNVVLKVGDKEKTLWLVSHIDTVPEGNASLWKYPPFAVTVEGDRIYGRGTADNGQAVITSLLLLKYLDRQKLKYNIGLAFCADEEVGSVYGIQTLISKNIFSKSDLIVVPDYGTDDGMLLEVAEKSIMWLKVTVTGKQYHASRPMFAINSLREGMKFMLKVDEMLHQKYNATDDIFEPNISTFEPTKHEANVANVNTVPGLDVFYIDCRVLPKYDLDLILDDLHKLAREFENTSEAKIDITPVQKEQSSPGTDVNSEVVKLLLASIEKVTRKEPRAIGIGGGTCAAYFRKAGMDAVAWSTTVEEVAHQPNEYAIMDNIVSDMSVFRDMLYGE
ncbi:MAG: M20 family metallo-hydrolase [Candidatus Thermoplasmatota archaeon]|nr:M20 family metallo-hydrolase [Candidatus Thermoplasmatota archaeon]MCL5438139.1 M20 family metallo-hydrolase [Candidatus Thermoplasmatota archaeon]